MTDGIGSWDPPAGGFDDDFVRAGRYEPPARTRLSIAQLGGQTQWRPAPEPPPQEAPSPARVVDQAPPWPTGTSAQACLLSCAAILVVGILALLLL
jgi:hypothetical protein